MKSTVREAGYKKISSQRMSEIDSTPPWRVVFLFELFCLQNSLIVGVQPQVSGKVGSLVGFWVANVRHSRRLSNFTERLVVGAGTKMQMRTHGKFCY